MVEVYLIVRLLISVPWNLHLCTWHFMFVLTSVVIVFWSMNALLCPSYWKKSGFFIFRIRIVNYEIMLSLKSGILHLLTLFLKLHLKPHSEGFRSSLFPSEYNFLLPYITSMFVPPFVAFFKLGNVKIQSLWKLIFAQNIF